MKGSGNCEHCNHALFKCACESYCEVWICKNRDCRAYVPYRVLPNTPPNEPPDGGIAEVGEAGK